MLGAVALAWAALAAAWRPAEGAAPRAILAWAIAFRVVAFFAAPVMEDDHWRFLWDGHRFATTGNPYDIAPRASFSDATLPAKFRAVLDHINHPDVPTVYGPGCQWAFRLCHAIAPAELWPWKLLVVGCELAIMALLWGGLSARGRLLLAWCPLAVFETGFNAHPEAIALLPLVAAWRLAGAGRAVAAGVAAGLAVTLKIFAAPLVPFLLWGRGARAWFAAGATVLGLYAPFWLRGSGADLAGLRAMAAEWEFNSSIHALVATAAGPVAARVVCGAGFAAIWFLVFARWARGPRGAMPPGDLVFGALLLFSAVANPWYALWLWPFVATRPTATGVAALAAVSVAYITGLNLGDETLGNFGHPPWLRPFEFGAIALAAMWDWRRIK